MVNWLLHTEFEKRQGSFDQRRNGDHNLITPSPSHEAKEEIALEKRTALIAL